MSSVPFSQDIDGFQVPGMFSADIFRGATKYKPRPDDLFLVTYPKCGTTWTGQILLLILRKGEPLENPSDLHAKAPFLEMTGVDFVDKMMRPGPIKTHLPFHLTPFSKDAKYICVTRNPKDCCVSYFHHMRNLPGHNFNGTFDQFFELFVSGKIDYGDYFDHLLSWYPHRFELIYLTYLCIFFPFFLTRISYFMIIENEYIMSLLDKRMKVNIDKKTYFQTKKNLLIK
nr:sulfotransferase ssu-1-like [Parasteatoda tepidariorum]